MSSYAMDQIAEDQGGERVPRLDTLPSTDSIHILLNDHLLSSSKPWTGYLPFGVYEVDDKSSITSTIFDLPPKCIDICAYLDGAKTPMQRLYFSPNKFPPPKDNNEMKGVEKKCAGWLKLKKATMCYCS